MPAPPNPIAQSHSQHTCSSQPLTGETVSRHLPLDKGNHHAHHHLSLDDRRPRVLARRLFGGGACGHGQDARHQACSDRDAYSERSCLGVRRSGQEFRGNLVKTIGQLAGTSSLTSDVVTSRFAVTDLVLDPTCDSGFPETPANGHYLGIHLNVESTPELAEEEFPWVSFTQYDWQAYDADGKRLNDPVGNAWTCLDSSQQLPAQIGPGQSVSGWIVLDVASPTGAVVLAMGGSPVGWEWAY